VEVGEWTALTNPPGGGAGAYRNDRLDAHHVQQQGQRQGLGKQD